MNNNTYPCGYVEVLEILKTIPQKEYNKIPKEKIEFYENNKDLDYVYYYNSNNTIISKKAKAILINLYKNYIATDIERNKIEEILKINDAKSEMSKREKYNPNDLFNNKTKKEKHYLIMLEKKQKWYEKIWDFIRCNILNK